MMIKIQNYITALIMLWLLSTLIQISDGQMMVSNVYLSEVEYDSTNNITSINNAYTMQVSIFTGQHLLSYYNPFSVMLPPKSWSDLCGTTIPNETKKEIQKKYLKDGFVHNDEYVWIFLNKTLSSTTKNNSCSTAEKMKNIEKLNSYLIRYTNGHTRGIISKLILQGGYGTFPSSYVNHIDILVVERYLLIEKYILQHENMTGINSHLFDSESNNWSYYMAITLDINDDGKVTLDDYNQYIEQEVNDDQIFDTNTSTGLFATIGIFIAILCFILLCMISIHRIHRNLHPSLPSSQTQRQQQQNQTTSRHTNQTVSGARTITTNSSNTTNNNNNNNNNSSNDNNITTSRVSLSEDDFASLPQMIYHEKKKQEEMAMPRIDEETTPPSAIVATTIECNLSNIAGVLSPDHNISIDQDNSQQVVPTLDNNTDKKNIESALEEITNSTINNNEHQHSLSYFRKTYGVSLKAIECCSICLEEFTDNEVVTALPQCCHLFHTACIGQWLLERKSNQCPMCKCNVLKI
jgi:Ring finger domain